MSKVHDLKIASKYFQAVSSGIKKFEIRKNDRGYSVGDLLILQEYDDGLFTGNKTVQEITYICDYEQKEGYVVLSICNVPISFITYQCMNKKEKSMFEQVLSHIHLYGYGDRDFSNTLTEILEILLDGNEIFEEDIKWYMLFWSED